jgi:hypothetical protein
MSCFVKSSGKDFAILGTDNNTSYYCVFDLANESVVYEPTNHEGKIEKYPNGWFRISSTYVSSGGNYPFIGVADNSSGSVIVDGDNGILIFGLQYEHESFPTSYIKSNSGSATTRSTETANGAGDATTFNDSEGVLMAEISRKSGSTESSSISLSDGTLSNAVSLYYFDANTLYVDIFNSSGTVTMSVGNLDTYINNKISLKYKNGDSAIWINGVEKVTSINAITLSGLNDLTFDYGNGAFYFYGKTKQIQYYNSALTDSELEQLTSWTSFTAMAQGQQYSIK